MKKSVLLVPVVCALALISACDETNQSSGPTGKPTGVGGKPAPVEKTPKKPERPAHWISLENGICTIASSDKATSSFEIVCPVEVTRLSLAEGIISNAINLKAGNYNGLGPVDASVAKQPDPTRIAGYVFGKQIPIVLILKDGKREVLVIDNPKSDAQKALEAQLAQEQKDLKQEFEQIASEVKRQFEALQESGGVHEGRTSDNFTYEGEILMIKNGDEVVYRRHGLGRVTNTAGSSLITQFQDGENAVLSPGYFQNPKTGLECAGMYLDLENKKGVCVKNGKYFRAES